MTALQKSACMLTANENEKNLVSHLQILQHTGFLPQGEQTHTGQIRKPFTPTASVSSPINNVLVLNSGRTPEMI